MRVKKYRYFMCDFETTVYKGQQHTEVWASASVELFDSTDSVQILGSIDEQFDYFVELNTNIIGYYHNLKFDGMFWLSFLLEKKKFKQAYSKIGDKENEVEWQKDKEMANNTFKYSVSNMGMWYTLIIKVNNHYIELRDSLKLLPFSVKRIGQSFKTKHKKLEMEYKGFRYSGCAITDIEKEYIANDVLVVKEALEIMFKDGHDKLTIGSCCLEEYKQIIGKIDYNNMFPDMYEIELNQKYHRYANAGEWLRKSYRGGWCYLVKGKENKVYNKGVTADVNSLYPSVMSSESGSYYPIGKPTFWVGNIPNTALAKDRYYFVRIKTRFYLREGYLPTIQIKSNLLYKSTEMLETSDIYNPKDGKYYPYYKDKQGNIKEAKVELTLTMTDYELIKEHYELVDTEYLDGCWFYSVKGIFDEYIEKYKKLKIVSTGAKRELAKLFLNNLYGKMASNTDSSFKLAYLKDDNSVGFLTVFEHNKQGGYIPCGTAITSYARNFTIRHAQQNYYGKDKRGFIYADTDSIHCDLAPNELKGIEVHDTAFCHWKLESCWDNAIFTRQKTYIEHVTHENLEECTPYYNVKCAGMPEKCKNLFIKSLENNDNMNKTIYNEEELEFLKTKRTIDDFKVGLKVPGKLMPKKIHGGVILVDTSYEMR